MNEIETELKRIEERCPFADVIGDTSFVESSGDVPKLVAALKYALHSMREYSQAHDFDTDDEMRQIAQILKG